MGLIPLLVLLGAVWYFTTPQERDRLRRAGLRTLDQVWGGASRYWPPRKRFDDALDARTPRPLVTLSIVALNVGMFVCMVMSPGSVSDPETLIGWGASIGTRTANGEWWRLVSAMFVHDGFMHMAANAFGLLQIGLITERFFGRFAVANAYLGAGLLFGVFSVLMHPVALTTGASASVFAIYGMFATMVFVGFVTPSPFTVPATTFLKIAPPAAIFLLYSFGTGHAGVLELCGLFVGLAYGMVLATQAAAVPAAHEPGAHVLLTATLSTDGMSMDATPTDGVRPQETANELVVSTISPKRIAPITAAIVLVVISAGIPMRGVIDVRPEIESIAALEQKTASTYDSAVRRFTNGELTLKELVGVIERTILPELRAAQTHLNGLQHVPRQQAKLVVDADQYFKLREESWQARAAGLRRTSLKGLRSPDDTEREARQLLESLITHH